jgi:CDP-paratose 2-epimerase
MKNSIIITGGLGFIGSHAAIHMYKLGFQVVIIDNLSRPTPNIKTSNNKSYNLSLLEKDYPEIIINIRDIREKKKILSIFNEYKPNCVLHAAGQTSAVGSIKDPENDFENNVIGLFNTLESARVCGTVKSFIFLSTNKVYGNSPNCIALSENKFRYFSSDKSFKGFNEQTSIDHTKHTPYGVSKISGDMYVQEYGQLYDFNTVVFRMSCIYGARQFGFIEQGWISHLIISSLLDKDITIFGDGKQVRDILFIDDLTRLFALYLEKSNAEPLNSIVNGSSVYNIGGGINYCVSLKEVLALIEEHREKPLNINYEDWRPGDQKIYVSDIQKVNDILGWKPEISPNKGIEMAFKWLSEHKDMFI